jgi:hypothetical protein
MLIRSTPSASVVARMALLCIPFTVSLADPSIAAAKKLTPAARCANAKLGAASRKLAEKLKCYQKAVAGGGTLHSACLARAEAAFAAAFGRAEAKGGCATSGDAAAIELQVDADVAALASALVPITITTTPRTTSTTTASTTTTLVVTTTTTLPACETLGAPCGTCGTGTCRTDATGFTVCAGGLCSGGPCASDAECGAEMVCAVVSTETGSTTTCCTACP